MIARLAMVVVLALGLSVIDTGAAQAQCGSQCGMYGYGFGYGYDVGHLYRVLAQNVPYYAAFPPVYYSAPIPRTYGYSPFAYPPGTMTPELELPVMAAKEIINPFVKLEEKAEEPAADKVTQDQSTATMPLAIVNPFVTSEPAGPILRAASLQ